MRRTWALDEDELMGYDSGTTDGRVTILERRWSHGTETCKRTLHRDGSIDVLTVCDWFGVDDPRRVHRHTIPAPTIVSEDELARQHAVLAEAAEIVGHAHVSHRWLLVGDADDADEALEILRRQHPENDPFAGMDGDDAIEWHMPDD